MNGKFNIEKLEEKIDQLDHNIDKLCCKNKKFSQTEINCKNIFQEKKLETIGDLIKALCHEMNQPLQAIAGYEKPVRDYMWKFMEPLADEVVYDNLGSIFAIKKSKKKDYLKFVF